MSNRTTLPMRTMSGVLILIGYCAYQVSACAEPPRGADCLATELLPETVVAYAEVSDLGGGLKTILNHPLRARLEAMPAYDAVVQSGALGKLKVGVAAFEGSMQQPWQQAVATIADRGVTVALDSSEGGVAVLIRSSDAETLERFRGFLLAVRQMQGGDAKQGDYRGFTADLVSDKLKMVRMHDWLVLTNKSELGKAIIDQYLDRGKESLQSNETFALALSELKSHETKQPLVSAFLDIEALRGAGVAKDVFNEKVDNFLGELVLGGILANVRQTTYATAKFDLNDDGLSLQMATPHDRDWEPPREYYFGAPELAAAPALLNVKNRLFALSSHRDLSQMWLRSGDLLSDRANDELAKADTQLTTFFSGRDFGEDILGSLGSDVQIVGKSQDFAGVLPQPVIKLPAFAIQFQMKNPEETQPELRRIFQSFIGFLNVTGAMNGQPQLDLGMENVGDAQLVTATYVPDRDQRESLDAKINFNFSPTVAFAGGRVILSSTTTLARELIALDDVPGNATAEPSNTFASIKATTLQQILQANRSQLVANNMLEKGHSKEAAEGEIGLLLELVGFFRDIRISLDITDTHMTFDVAVDVNSETESQP